MRPAGSRHIKLRLHKPESRMHLRHMETSLPWLLSFSHGRQIRATIIRKPKHITRSIPFSAEDSVFNWDSKTPGLAVLFAQLANSGASYAGNLSGWQAESERYFDTILNGGGPSFKTKGACDFRPSRSK
jgi:hypothetical protein